MMMNNSMPMSTMLNPFESSHLSPMYDSHQQPPKRFLPYRVARVVRDQKHTFETNELFRKHARESEHIIYTPAYLQKKENKDVDEKLRQKFLTQCKEGSTEIVFTSSGIVLQLSFNHLDFNKEQGKAHIKSHHMILNGVCVRWKGVIDLQSLNGVGCLEFDEENARVEDALAADFFQWESSKFKDFTGKRNSLKLSPYPPTTSNIKVE